MERWDLKGGCGGGCHWWQATLCEFTRRGVTWRFAFFSEILLQVGGAVVSNVGFSSDCYNPGVYTLSIGWTSRVVYTLVVKVQHICAVCSSHYT